jgi:hypothetical protein
MQSLIENLMYQVGQIFLFPTLLLITLLFFYSFWLLGKFSVQWHLRRGGGGRPLLGRYRRNPHLSPDEIDLMAHRLLESPQIISRAAPLLGLVATMIPMGPALKDLSQGDLSSMSGSLAVAFSAVILALLAASVTYWIVNVQRRWMSEEILAIEELRGENGEPETLA